MSERRTGNWKLETGNWKLGMDVPPIRARLVPQSSPRGQSGAAPPSRRRSRRDTTAFRSTRDVDVSSVLDALCGHARVGYHEPYKREVIGLLFGRVARGGAVRCLKAVPYHARCRARTRCDPNPEALRRRARALAAATRLGFLGCYHSHPEEAGSRAWALSPEDREIFYAERASRIEVVVSVAEAGRRVRVPALNPRRNKDGTISLWADLHHFRLSAEVKRA
jgi:proteasome lid subunit RPN8/RPN11